jgi:hypothetical protein
MPRIVFAVLLAALSAAVAASRVYHDFERVRLRVITSPLHAATSELYVALPDLTPLAASRAAFVLRLRGTSVPADLVVSFDGRRLARLSLPAGEEVRVDLAAPVMPGEPSGLILSADRAGWDLTYLEVANVHGYSQGLVDLLILPHDRAAPGRFRPALFAIVLVALVALMPRPAWPTGLQRWLYWSGVALVAVLFGGALLAEIFTRFRVLISLSSFLLCTAILYAEPISRLRAPLEPHVRRAWPHAVAGVRRWGPLVPYVAIPALLLWTVAQFYRPEVGFTELVKFGSQFSATAHPTLRDLPHFVEPGAGYDGQFYAQLVFDPLVRSDAIATALDSPGYRARRILFPWIAYLAGLGDPWRALQAYALLNVACWLALAWLLVRWLPPGSARRTAAWCGCVLADGMLASVRQSLVDGPSMLLLALVVVAAEQNRRGLATGLLAIAGLGRDTNVIGGFVLAPADDRWRRWAAAALTAGLACVPLLAWMLYLRHVDLSPAETGYANFAWPLVAFLQKWQTTVAELSDAGWESFARFSVLSLIALTTQLAVLLALMDWRSAWWRMGIAYAGLMMVLGESVWDGYPGATARVVLPMTVAFNVLLPRVRWFWPLWVLGNASIPVGLYELRVPWIWTLI